ncbi:MAG: hypothetical protein WAU91_10805 [Desulfatitalea sp.]
MNTLSIRRNWNIVILCIVFFLSTTCWAGELAKGGDPGNQPAGKEGQNRVLDTIRVTIEKKSLETVTTNIGDKYSLSDNTIIVDTDGQQVSTRKMLVPCEAEIAYSTEKGVRMAERINIKSVSNNASWKWSSDRPE